ncbi:Asp-tRNA(Asn)/Glu-tRNA(Gln) amidotransferase subunit GatB [Candidatus Bipolaricaulota bacterium]|nr:Asp-tRNA(Asn)/Glu-tRNA(Gln) amidotransferase subunit GatB [Candidatus Bipolaricaulota bacterium]
MQTVIGLEIHAQLLTETKLFCGCSADYFGKEPNSNTCPVCLGMPGTLPVLNKRAVDYGLRAATALNCEIPKRSKFDRKNYFYPDLPKGYQISQFDEPLAVNGYLKMDGEKIRIRRVHLEEDAGKLVHQSGGSSSVDLNRVGVPLIEIVTEPDLNSPGQARDFMEKLRQILRYVEVCSGDMEKGSLRCDANISLKDNGEMGTKTEVKNMNSFRAVESALSYEENRQRETLESGGKIDQVTLGWNADAEEARPMRSKEEAHDYRYFPEPDLVPLVIDEGWKKKIEKNLPELPREKENRWKEEFDLPDYDIGVLTEDKKIADYFERAVGEYNSPKKVSNWMMSELFRVLKLPEAELTDVEPASFAYLVQLVDEEEINDNTAKDVLEKAFTEGKSPKEIVEAEGLKRISDEGALTEKIDEVIEENPDAVEDFRSGNENVLGYLIGQLMSKTQGQADPNKAREILKEKL